MARNIGGFDDDLRILTTGGSHSDGSVTTESRPAERPCLDILVLDDEAATLDPLLRALERMEACAVRIVGVQSPEEALSAARDQDFHIMFLDEATVDAAMPLLQALARSEPSCPPIVLTAPAPDGASGPSHLADGWQTMDKATISPLALEMSIRTALVRARRRDILMAQLETISTVGESSDEVLPWLKTLLAAVDKTHSGAVLAMNRTENETARRLLLDSAAQSRALKTDLLDKVTRLENSHRSFDRARSEIDLTGLVADVVADYRAEAERRGQTLTYLRPDLPVKVDANPSTVRDLVRVALRNTLRHNGCETNIRVELSFVHGAVRLSIVDTDPGGHWTSAEEKGHDARPEPEERAGGLLLIEDLMFSCAGIVETRCDSGTNYLTCVFPRRRGH
ncbi:MAG: hypothetical protein AAGL24_08765 [Pseudomonadota bacterium]